MFHNRKIADELAGIRSDIAALKSREKMLREVVLSDPDSRSGQHHEVVIKRQKRRVLLRDRLPAHILKNPAYWDEQDVSYVTLRECRARDGVVDLSAHRQFAASPVDEFDFAPERAVRPGDPVAGRTAVRVLHLVAPEPAEDDVLESFTG